MKVSPHCFGKQSSTSPVASIQLRLVFALSLVIGAWFTGSAATCYAKSSDESAVVRPNFVQIVADDAGWRDVGFHGSEIATPNLDRLAEAGVVLDHFYVCPTCSPTRAAIMIGRPSSRVHIFTPVGGGVSADSLPLGTLTLPELLRENGYTTAISGKWHLGESPKLGPRQFGFEHSYGFFRGQVDPYTHRYKTGERTWHRNDQYVDEEGHATDLITNEALAFINEQAAETKPFFLSINYSVPHYPLNEPDRWIVPYRNSITNESRQLFAAAMTHMDDAIGRVITALNEAGLSENTLVIFMSDNGGQRSWMDTKNFYEGRYAPNDRLGDNRPLRDWKTQLYEGGIRVPALMAWPGTLAPRKVSEVLAAWDLYPTLAHLAGATIPAEAQVEGLDVWLAITGQGSLPTDRTLYWRTPGGMAVRKGTWKLLHKGKSLLEGSDELYNIFEDPFEKHECGKLHRQKVIELQREMARQRGLD